MLKKASDKGEISVQIAKVSYILFSQIIKKKFRYVKWNITWFLKLAFDYVCTLLQKLHVYTWTYTVTPISTGIRFLSTDITRKFTEKDYS